MGREPIKVAGGHRSVTRNEVVRNEAYRRSREERRITLEIAQTLKGNPLSFTTNNGIRMDVEVTLSDIKTICAKNTSDNSFNARKNVLARDIRRFIEKGKYEGWSPTKGGKHPEAVYFAYYSKGNGKSYKAYLCLRKMRSNGKFKPYAIINQRMFDADIGSVEKTKVPQ